MNRKRKWLNVPFLRADTHRPSPPTCFWAANSTNSSSKCSRDDLASSSQICKSCITKVGHGFESRRCHKNFTKKTFLPISKNVRYRSLACLWPKLWAFWVLLLSYNGTTKSRSSMIVWRHDGSKYSIPIIRGSVEGRTISCFSHYEQSGYFLSGYWKR